MMEPLNNPSATGRNVTREEIADFLRGEKAGIVFDCAFVNWVYDHTPKGDHEVYDFDELKDQGVPVNDELHGSITVRHPSGEEGYYLYEIEYTCEEQRTTFLLRGDFAGEVQFICSEGEPQESLLEDIIDGLATIDNFENFNLANATLARMSTEAFSLSPESGTDFASFEPEAARRIRDFVLQFAEFSDSAFSGDSQFEVEQLATEVRTDLMKILVRQQYYESFMSFISEIDSLLIGDTEGCSESISQILNRLDPDILTVDELLEIEEKGLVANVEIPGSSDVSAEILVKLLSDHYAMKSLFKSAYERGSGTWGIGVDAEGKSAWASYSEEVDTIEDIISGDDRNTWPDAILRKRQLDNDDADAGASQ
jgi:hypothetical protein